MGSIKEVVFSINTDSIVDLVANESFIYNFYSESETFDDDDVIDIRDNDRFKNRFIRLRLSIENTRSNDLEEYNKENFNQSILDFSKLESLNVDNLKYFNKLDNFVPGRKNIVRSLNRSEARKNIDFMIDIDKVGFSKSEITNKGIINQKSSLLNSENDNFSRLYLNSKFPEKGNFENIRDYEKIIYDYNDKVNRKDTLNKYEYNGDMFPNSISFERIINEYSYKQYSKKNAVKCGLLIEKFVKNEDDYNLLCGKFFTTHNGEEKLEIPRVIEDKAVKYGKTYRYVLSFVYLYTYPDPENRFVLKSLLVCDNSFITGDIVCKEKVRPKPPVALDFRYDEDKKGLVIQWKKPNNTQNDIKGFQILKRKLLDEPFKLVAQLEGHLSSDLYEPQEISNEELIKRTPGKVHYKFIDYDYNPNVIEIYSIRSIDAHGMFSDYSMQIGLLYDKFQQKLIKDVISLDYAKRNMPNQFILENTIFFNNEVNFVDNLPVLRNVNRISLYVTPDFVNINNRQNVVPVLDEKYQFTIFRMNDLIQYKKEFEIKNFIIEDN